MKMHEYVCCTIVARNYLSQAFAWLNSLKKYNDSWKAYILVIDANNEECMNYKKMHKGKAKFLHLDDLNYWQYKHMVLRYDVVEFSTAIKPTLMLYLNSKHPDSYIFYFDPDIYFYSKLSHLENLTKKHDMLLVAHTLKPVEDQYGLSLLHIQATGVFNLAFIGVNLKNKEVVDCIKWWQRKLEYTGYNDTSGHVFVDQLWANFFPCFVSSCHIIRHPGYDIAYFNLHERFLHYRNSKLSVNDKPVYFIHYSGFNPYKPEFISKYQNRYFSERNYTLYELGKRYAKELIDCGWSEYRKNKYRYNYLPDGTRLNKEFRKWYIKMERNVLQFGPEPEKNRQLCLRAKYKFFRRLDTNIKLTKYNLVPTDTILKRFVKDNINFVIDIVKSVIDFRFKVFFKSIFWRNIYNIIFYNIKTVFLMPVFILKKIFIRNKALTVVNNSKIVKKGVLNVYGYFSSELGIADSARGIVKALDAVKLKSNLYNFEFSMSRKKNLEYENRYTDNEIAPFSLVCVNADQIYNFFIHYSKSALSYSKYKIGYWYWETASFPKRYSPQYFGFDEIWVATEFVKKSIEKELIIPVNVIPPSFCVPESISENKQKFGLHEDKKQFLMLFDGFSYMERKNPIAVINAFRMLINDNNIDNEAELVIKTINLSTAEKRNLKEMTKDLPVVFISDYINDTEIFELIKSCDCYISLHRSEGLGIPLIYAMQLGNPVITTGYSGNLDFMNKKNSYLVDYSLIELKRDYGPYLAGSCWADPEIESAAAAMYEVFSNEADTEKKAALGQKNALKYFAPDRIGKLILNRLNKYK